MLEVEHTGQRGRADVAETATQPLSASHTIRFSTTFATELVISRSIRRVANRRRDETELFGSVQFSWCDVNAWLESDGGGGGTGAATSSRAGPGADVDQTGRDVLPAGQAERRRRAPAKHSQTDTQTDEQTATSSGVTRGRPLEGAAGEWRRTASPKISDD